MDHVSESQSTRESSSSTSSWKDHEGTSSMRTIRLTADLQSPEKPDARQIKSSRYAVLQGLVISDNESVTYSNRTKHEHLQAKLAGVIDTVAEQCVQIKSLGIEIGKEQQAERQNHQLQLAMDEVSRLRNANSELNAQVTALTDTCNRKTRMIAQLQRSNEERFKILEDLAA